MQAFQNSNLDFYFRLQPILKSTLGSELNLSSLLESGYLKAFAHFETKRKCYGRDDVNIVIDATDWGHTVGEIEMVVSDPSQIPEASLKIEQIAAQLGDHLHNIFRHFFQSCFVVCLLICFSFVLYFV